MLLLEELKGYKSILVTGPQRSGTTIAARILSVELGKRYADENEIAIYDWLRALKLMREPIVLQAPGLMYICSIFNPEDIAVVVMRRSLDEIYASEKRIEWRTKYDGMNVKVENDLYQSTFGKIAVGGNIAAMKYEVWETIQKPRMKNAFELPYESLSEHYLFKTEREGFGERQWK